MSAVKHGVGVLAGSLVGTPIMYFLGLAILGSGLGLGNAIMTGYSNRAAQVAQSKQHAQAKSQEAASTSSEALDMAGKWKGQFVYLNGAKADFTMTLANPSGHLISGDMTEVDPNTKQSLGSVISGNASQGAIAFKQIYSGQPEVACSGQYLDSPKQIKGVCSVGNQSAEFVAKKETGLL